MDLIKRTEQIGKQDIYKTCSYLKKEGWRYVQILCINREKFVDIIYTFMKDGELLDIHLNGVENNSTLPSITDLFLAAFVCENEICDLFGISFSNSRLAFSGKFYTISNKKPMTIISPEELKRREREAKIAAAKAAKAKKEMNASSDGANLSKEEK